MCLWVECSPATVLAAVVMEFSILLSNQDQPGANVWYERALLQPDSSLSRISCQLSRLERYEDDEDDSLVSVLLLCFEILVLVLSSFRAGSNCRRRHRRP